MYFIHFTQQILPKNSNMNQDIKIPLTDRILCTLIENSRFKMQITKKVSI